MQAKTVVYLDAVCFIYIADLLKVNIAVLICVDGCITAVHCVCRNSGENTVTLVIILIRNALGEFRYIGTANVVDLVEHCAKL